MKITETQKTIEAIKYECGLNDAWEVAKKIVSNKGYTGEELENIFGTSTLSRIFDTYTASEAIEMIEKYEKEQKTPVFKVGDRVRTTGERDRYGIVLFPVGTIGEVTEVDCDGGCLVKAYETYEAPYYYPANALELANDVILVGDEVWLLDKYYHGVVTAVWENFGVVKTERLTQSGKLACDDAKDLHRTGRRFPEIINILKQMQEGNEND